MKCHLVQPVKSKQNFFITQDVGKHNFIEEGTSTANFDDKRDTTSNSNCNSISDQRIKGVLNRVNINLSIQTHHISSILPSAN